MSPDFRLNFELTNPTSFVSFEDTRFPIGLGGIRLFPNVNEHEVKLLANAMARKLHYFHLPIGGAKAGINSSDINDLYRFVNHKLIKSMLTGNNPNNLTFVTGPDLGTSEAEFQDALTLAGLDEFRRSGLLAQKSETHGLQLDNIVTALGCIESIKALIAYNGDLADSDRIRISIEGFGKIGTGIAALLQDNMDLVGVSTKFGSVYNTDGFSAKELLDAQKKHGDKFIYEISDNINSTAQLFEEPSDIIIPGARTEVITSTIAKSIINKSKPNYIVPVANFPYTDEGRQILERNKILCFPDFISSAGAVIAAITEFAEVGTEENATKLGRDAMNSEISDLLRSKKSHESIFMLAKNQSLVNKSALLKEVQNSKGSDMKEISTKFIEKYSPNLL
ncbi:MAG: Glu/Leu/Phe/Val dehydrogenase [Candidatus Heimdallarchaeota archaeon]|nr:Glu/Leu/Phe/Val dehydrogenase [Candidatus Heimdallarchaeota archaeon]